MVPGVSRSGATIVGAMLMGADKRAAAEFSFFLAMPTMAGAFAYDLLKSWSVLTTTDAMQIGLGFVASFVVAVLVVRHLLDYVSATASPCSAGGASSSARSASPRSTPSVDGRPRLAETFSNWPALRKRHR